MGVYPHVHPLFCTALEFLKLKYHSHNLLNLDTLNIWLVDLCDLY